LLIFSPRIVAVREYQAFGKGRVRIHPKSDECGRIWISKIDFTESLEGLRGNLSGVWHDPMN
jgi:hypothetical protein